MNASKVARIDGIVAPEGRCAVIFRRGPSKLTRQLVWHFDTDEIVPGQWIRGRVYTRRCDVSPDGRLLVGAYTNYSSRHRDNRLSESDQYLASGWTAISRPPYYTAIGLWFSGGAWNGGGIWKSNREVALNDFANVREMLAIPRPFRKHSLGLCGSEDEPIFSMLMQKRGWQRIQAKSERLINRDWKRKAWKAFLALRRGDYEPILTLDILPRFELIQPGSWVKPIPNGELRRLEESKREIWSLHDREGREHRAWEMPQFGTQWLDVDPRGRIVFGEGGKLWAWEGFPEGAPIEIADLNPMRFEEVAPPAWARQWPD